MNEIVIISGKGGTGKTSLTASLALTAGREAIAADCDVDAADMHLLLEPDFGFGEDFYSGLTASIDQNKCLNCGTCMDTCRFDAINIIDGNYNIDDLDCEGCGYCARVCPEEAIIMSDQKAGRWFVSNIKNGSKMVHARLGIGADNSGKLVTKVKNEAKKLAEETDAKYVIVDGSPGIGCPVISSISGADLVIFVTEPTVSGIHDLKRVHKLVANFNIKSACIINKSDINPEVSREIAMYLKKEKIIPLMELNYDEDFTRAMTEGKAIIEYSEIYREKIAECWEKIKSNFIKNLKVMQ